MDWVVEHWVAVALLCAYAAVLVFQARVGLNRSRGGIADYLVGGRSIGGLVIGVSFFATFASTNSYIGLAGKGYDYGIPWLLFALLIVVATWLSWIIVAPSLRRFTAATKTVTVPEFLAVRFNSQFVRLTTGLVIAFSSLLYLIAIFKGAGHLFQVFLGIPYWASVGLMFVVVMLYTSVGGFVSVVRTDVLQGCLMVLGSITLFYFITRASGGVTAIADLARDESTAHLFTWNAGIPFAVLLGIAVAGSMKLLIDPRQVSRFYGLRDDESVRRGILIAVVGILVIQFCLFPLGIYAHALLDGITDTDLVIPTLINDPSVIPLAVADFLIVAIISAAMSSMDSVLLVAGSVIVNDVLGSYQTLPERKTVMITRLGIVVIASLAALIALDPPGGIVEITIFSGSLYAVCFVPTLLIGLHWRRGTNVAAVASIVLGIAALLFCRYSVLRETIHEVFPALLVSVSTYVLISLFHTPRNVRVVERYFDEERESKELEPEVS